MSGPVGRSRRWSDPTPTDARRLLAMYRVTGITSSHRATSGDRMDDDTFFAAFRRGSLDPAGFDHRAHLRAAACALARMPFLEACIAMRDGVRLVAARAGDTGRYHETITVAFMALIADAQAACDGSTSVERLVAAGPALLDREAIARLYRAETLADDDARRRFRLPDVAGTAP